ncbi:hypothetical protein LCGC14_0836760 [marine sediment metagenome]|uniref:Uncharacterized protein n=1 Tax=marine sediment metagenome TaxID=412755 RepID=A0A0F9PZL0_9ZZZZ
MPLFSNEQEILNQPITVDGSGVTQPVSGTVTANAGSGTFTVDGSGVTQPISAASLPLPAGAATETTLAAIDAGIPAGLGQTTMSASMPVAIASDQSAIPVTFTPAALTITATVSTVAVSTTVATLSLSNTSKTGVVIHNEGGTLFVKFGSVATPSDYTYRLTQNTVLEVTNYAGLITGIKLAGGTDVQVTELGI